MAQQTAVEWLEQEINKRGPKENNPPQWLKDLYEQAKQMEWEQMINLTETLTSTPSHISRDAAILMVNNFIKNKS